MNEFKNTEGSFNQKLIDFGNKFKFRDEKINKLISVAVFVIGIHFFYTYVGIYKFMDKRPCSVHMSAQCSRASIALNYFENDMNFFTPQYQRNIDGKGYTGLEFPVIYYLGAVSYKLFGFNEIYLRGISLIIMSFGLLFFYLLTLKFSKNNLISLSIIFAIVCSPVLVFYSANFMPDPPSLGLILASWFFLFKYFKTDKDRHLNLFVIMAGLGVLLKFTAASCFAIVFILMLLDKLKFFSSGEKMFLFNNKKKVIVRIVLAFVVIISWYKYSAWFPKSHGGQTFLLSVNMYDGWESLITVLKQMRDFWLNHYYSSESYILLGLVFIFILLGFKFIDRLLFSITILYLLGSLCYFLLFQNQFIHHDYYIITILPTLFFLFLCFADIVNKISEKYFYPVKLLLLIVIFFNLKESFLKTKNKMYERNSTDIFYWTGDFRAYEDLEPKLRNLGIKREDRVVSGYDNTDCGSLYLMNQLGVTFGNEALKHDVDSFIQHKNVKYLILSDSAKFKREYNYDFSKNIIATHRGLIIYKIK